MFELVYVNETLNIRQISLTLLFPRSAIIEAILQKLQFDIFSRPTLNFLFLLKLKLKLTIERNDISRRNQKLNALLEIV